MKSGLYARPGFSPTWKAAALASWLLLPFDETREGEIRVESAAYNLRFARFLLGNSRIFRIRHRRLVAARSDLDPDARAAAVAGDADELLDATEEVLLDPGNDEAVRREELQLTVALDRLQRANPGVELLLRDFALEMLETVMPQRALHEPFPALCCRTRKGEESTAAKSAAPELSTTPRG
jgi:hypothetical protein